MNFTHFNTQGPLSNPSVCHGIDRDCLHLLPPAGPPPSHLISSLLSLLFPSLLSPPNTAMGPSFISRKIQSKISRWDYEKSLIFRAEVLWVSPSKHSQCGICKTLRDPFVNVCIHRRTKTQFFIGQIVRFAPNKFWIFRRMPAVALSEARHFWSRYLLGKVPRHS